MWFCRDTFKRGGNKVHSFSLGIVETNCYILEGENELLVIDPGDNGEF